MPIIKSLQKWQNCEPMTYVFTKLVWRFGVSVDAYYSTYRNKRMENNVNYWNELVEKFIGFEYEKEILKHEWKWTMK